ncbi:uncharacterized protein LOC134693355 [Mytilus trossulus]|uniref:uncharacterized protein LOC134693355 n=1 Tax=Mytilus trossulus TaxID=6551 RepID=UPI003003EED0
MRPVPCTILAIVLFAALSAAQMGEFHDMMRGCVAERGFCIDVNKVAAQGTPPGEAAEAAEAAAGAAPTQPPPPAPRGRRRGRGPNPLGRAHQPRQPPQLDFFGQMNILNTHCASYDFEPACMNTGGYCCFPHP